MACWLSVPLPSIKPNRRLRDWLSVQVSTKSPKPDMPIKVCVFAPMDTPKRVISAIPRVINAVLALAPNPMPSENTRTNRNHVFNGTPLN